MIGMNIIFHVAAAVGFGVLIWMVLRVQKQRDLLRSVLASARESIGRGTAGTSSTPTSSPSLSQAAAVRLMAPAQLLGDLAMAMGIEFENEAGLLKAPRRIELAPLGELFLRYRVSLIRCHQSSNGPAVQFFLDRQRPTDGTNDASTPEQDADVAQLMQRLADGIGGGVQAQLNLHESGGCSS